MVPAERLSVVVADLLPDGIVASEDGEAFQLVLASASFSESLGELCAICSTVGGLTLPKPAFNASFSGSIPLPDAVRSARLIGGELRIRLRHDFAFDPLRPGGSERGYLVLTASSGGTELARDSIPGEQASLGPGVDINRVLELQPATIAGPIDVRVTIDSPEGSPVRIDLDESLTVEVAAAGVTVEDAHIVLTDQPIPMTYVELDLSGIDEWVTRRVRAGAVQVEIDNPFDITATFDLALIAPGVEIARMAEVPPGASSTRVSFTGEELRSVLGVSGVRMAVAGSASSPAEGTLVRPADEIRLGTNLELTIGTAETDE